MRKLNEENDGPAEDQDEIPVLNEESYFELLNRVGSGGKYQWLIYIIALCTFLQVGLISFNEPFLFMNPTFDCSHLEKHYTEQECEKYVCNNLTPEQI